MPPRVQLKNKRSAPPGNARKRLSRVAPYPFSAIVGQDEMKLSLILSVIDPQIGGVLIMGHRGTGKSTAVRALADLLPEIRVVARCLYGCDPTNDRNLCDDCANLAASGAALSTTTQPVPVV